MGQQELPLLRLPPHREALTASVRRPVPDQGAGRRRPAGVRSQLAGRGPYAVALVVVLVRLPLLHLPAWADEAGFLQVGAGWHLGGHDAYLYGGYWVDRPPLLITLFGVAARLGGLVALRLMGALAAVLVVLGVARLVRVLSASGTAGSPASGALWAAVAAAALLCSPYQWGFMVDGELLAVPFVVAGMLLLATALTRSGVRALAGSAAAGLAGTAALLVKQNFADVFVFAVALLALRVIGRSLPLGVALRHLAAGILGAVVGLGLGLVWTVAHGTTLSRLWYALYRFRLDAAGHEGAGVSLQRLGSLGVAAVLSGLVLLVVAALATAWLPSSRDAAVGALVVVLAFDVFSVAAGTNYWPHYLVQPSVPVAALVGLLVARGAPVRVAGALAALLAVIGWTLLVSAPPQTGEELVGGAIGGAARPGDGLVTVSGRANVNLAAGLASPYPYLWSLPAQTLDPGRHRLLDLLDGPTAPTWFVSWSPVPRHGLLAGVLRSRYRPVATVCGRTIYRRADESRPVPRADPRSGATRGSRCVSVTRLPFPLDDLP